MAVRLQRKVRKNKVKAAKRKADLKRLTFLPTIKRINPDTIRKSFTK